MFAANSHLSHFIRDDSPARAESPDFLDIMGQMLAVIRPASTAFFLQAPLRLASSDVIERFGRSVEAALAESCPEPAEVAIVPVGPLSLAAILTPRSEQPLDAVAVHAILLNLRRLLPTALPETLRAIVGDL